MSHSLDFSLTRCFFNITKKCYEIIFVIYRQTVYLLKSKTAIPVITSIRITTPIVIPTAWPAVKSEDGTC